MIPIIGVLNKRAGTLFKETPFGGLEDRYRVVVVMLVTAKGDVIGI